MVENVILPVFTGGKFYTACFLMVEHFILSKIFSPKFSCIKSSMPDIPKFSNHQKPVCIKFSVKNFPVSRFSQPKRENNRYFMHACENKLEGGEGQTAYFH